jgi:hypothetical protein
VGSANNARRLSFFFFFFSFVVFFFFSATSTIQNSRNQQLSCLDCKSVCAACIATQRNREPSSSRVFNKRAHTAQTQRLLSFVCLLLLLLCCCQRAARPALLGAVPRRLQRCGDAPRHRVCDDVGLVVAIGDDFFSSPFELGVAIRKLPPLALSPLCRSGR